MEKLKFPFIIILVILGAFMAILDTTIVDIIIPKLQAPLSTDMYGVQWVITAYMLSAAVGLLIVEWFVRKYGSKNIYLIGVMIFTTASFLCGVSESLGFMIFARAIQGLGEAFIMVTAHILIFSLFPPEKKGVAMGIFAFGVAFAPAIGPTLGGYLTDLFVWRSVFFVNVPIGIFLIVFGFLFIPDKTKRSEYKINLVSVIFLSITTLTLLIILSKGQQNGWFKSDLIVYLAFISWFSFLGFIINEYYSKLKLFDYKLFKNRYYLLGNLIYLVVLGFSMYQYFYLIPIYYEKIKHFTTLQAGIGMFSFGIFIGVFSILAGVLSDKFSTVKILVVGGILYLISIYLISGINYYTPFNEAILRTIPFGISMGLFFAPVTTLILQNASSNIEQASTTMKYFRFIGGSFGTAIATNNIIFYANREFDGMSILQNRDIVNQFLDKVSNVEVFRNIESVMSLAYGFKYVWLWAGFWGILGSMLIFSLLYQSKMNLRH